jgi:methyl-accepting chemotaxis protein
MNRTKSPEFNAWGIAICVCALSEKSKKIGQITKLIDEIADQTNLLAVNASIEAARAGEHGRGFTVVADEIGKLADSTAQSTKEIDSLIKLIQSDVSNAILSMEQSRLNVEEEIHLANKSAQKAKEIAFAAKQQISGSRQIADSMGGIDTSMKNITTSAQQSQDAVAQLAELAHELENTMTQFKVDMPACDND